MSNRRTAFLITVSLAGLAAADAARAGVTLTSLNRFQWASTGIDTGSDGEFNQHNAPAGFAEWNDSISADSFTGGSSAVASGMFTSPLVTPDSICISLYGEATATCNDAAFVSAEVNQEFILDFNVTDAPAALIFNADKDATFIGNGLGVAHGRLERLSPTYSLLWDTGLACNSPFILEPGSYRLTVNTYAGASVDNQIGVSSTHHGTIDVDIVSGVTVVYEIDSGQSALTLDIAVPGMPPQQETIHLEGTVELLFAECPMWAISSVALLAMDLHMQEAELVVQTTGDPVTLTSLAITPTILGDAAPLEASCCGLADGCCATLTGNQLQAQGVIAPPALNFRGPGVVVWLSLIECLVEMRGTGDDLAGGVRTSAGSGLSYETIEFPGINIVDAPIDLGLGAMNPTATITGDIVGIRDAASAPCPGDTNGDGKVDIDDFLALLGEWGPCPTFCSADFDGNGAVDIDDFLALLGAWGPCP